MTGSTTTVGIEVRADGTQKAARDLADVDASLKKINAGLGGTVQPAGAAAQGLSRVGASAKKAAEGLGSVSKFASTAKFDKVVSDLGTMGVTLNTGSLHAQKLAQAMQQVERERAFRQLAQDANLSTLQFAKLRAALGDTRGALATLTNGFGLSKAAVLAWAAAIAFGGKACLDAALQADRLSKAYTTITGSSSAAEQQLSYLYDVSNRLGLQFQSTAESAKTFFAAGKGTSLEKDLNNIFEAVSSAGTALSLSTDDMQGAFLALGQMISKGKVQAEELRGQLGERLPGAFQLAAKAMGMTTAELDKFMADGKLTAEVLLPKLAKVMREDFGAAAEAAANGLQGQMNRLSTEWTRLKASMIDSDSIARVFGSLSQAMKLLADHGESIAAVIGKGLQWAAWTAGVYAFIKAVAGLVTVFQTLKAVSGTLSFAGIATAAGPVAAALGLVLTGVTSLVMAQDKGAEIGKRYAGVTSDIESALKKQAQAAKDAKDGTDQLSESQKKLAASQAIEDRAQALMEMQSLATGKGWLEILGVGGDSDEAVDRIKGKTLELLTAIRTGQGDISQLVFEIDNLGTTSNEAAHLAATILDWLAKAEKAGKIAGGEFAIVADAAHKLVAAADEAKASLATGWTIDVSDAVKGIAALEKGIRAFQAERLGMKGSKLTDILSDFSPDAVKRAQDAYASKGFGMALKELGIAVGSLTAEQERNLNAAFRLQKQYDAEAKTTEAYRKAVREAEKDHTSAFNQMENNAASYKSEVEQTEASIRSLRAQLAAKPGDVFSREQSKILADYEAAYAKINEEADKYARKKGITQTQAEELKKQKLMEAALQRDLSLRQAQEKEEKRLADLAKDRYDFYKELEELTGQYGLSLKYQSEVIEAQVKELERLQIPQQYIDQWRQLKELQASHDWADGAVRGVMKFKAEASDAAAQTEDAFNGLFTGIQSASLNMWENFLESGKLSLSSFKSVFKSFIAQLLQIAIMNPIIVQIAGGVQGVFASGNAAGVAGASGGLNIGGLSNLSGLLPDSWTAGVPDFFSGITATINDTVASWFPNTFSSTAGYLNTAGTELLKANVLGVAPPSVPAPPTFMQQAGSLIKPFAQAAGAYAITGMVDQALGLSKTYTNVGKYAQYGAALGSFLPIPGGTFIGAGIGGLVGRLTGKRKPKRPAVWSQMTMNLAGTGMPDAYGDSPWTKAATDYYAVNASGRNKASDELITAFTDPLAQAGQAITEQVKGITAALPDDYAERFRAQLEARPVKLEWDVKDKDIDDGTFQNMVAEVQEKAAAVMLESFQALDFSEYAGKIEVDTANMEGLTKFTQAVAVVDETLAATKELQEPTSEWVTQARAAVAQMDAWEETMKSTGVTADYAASLMEDYRTAYVGSFVKSLDEMLHPLSEIERQTKTTMESLKGYEEALKLLGGTADDLAKVEQARGKVQADLLGKVRAYVDATPEIVSQTEAMNAEFDALRESMILAGSATADLAELERARAAAVAAAKAAYTVPFYDDLRVRGATLTGGDVTGLQLDVAHRKELEEAAGTFGDDSAEYEALKAIQYAEKLQHQADLAQAAADSATSAYEAAKSKADGFAQSAAQAQAAVTAAEKQAEAARLALVQGLVSAVDTAKTAMKSALDSWVSGTESTYDKAKSAYLSALESEASELESTLDAHRSLAEALRQTRRNLWLDPSLSPARSVYTSSRSEIDRLYALAMSGDTDAANELQSVAKAFLDASYSTQGDYGDYLRDFDEVQAKLKAVEEEATRQAETQESELDALQAEMLAARKQMERAQAEQKRVYGQWGFEAVVPGISGLEAEYRAQAEALRAADRDLNAALIEGLTSQSEIASLRVTSKIDELRSSLSTSLSAIQTAIADNARAQAESARAAAEAAKAKAEAERLAAEAEAKKNAAQQAGQAAQDKVEATQHFAGSKYATEYALLSAKVASLNRGEYVDPRFNVPAGDWNANNTKRAMIETYGSVESWYAHAGRLEGFATGGLASPGWAIVGERGPELVDFATPGRVYTADQTQRMLAPAWGTSDGPAAQLVWMRERMDRQTAVLSAMYGVLRDIRKYGYRTSDGVEALNENGIGMTKTATVRRTTWAE